MSKKKKQSAKEQAYLDEQFRKFGTRESLVTVADEFNYPCSVCGTPWIKHLGNNCPDGVPARPVIRTFDTGATRDVHDDKPDYAGFISPLVTKRYGAYMHKHRKQADGTLRASNNWQKGIPIDAYNESLARHVNDVQLHHDGFSECAVEPLEDALCAIIFNASGWLFEIGKARLSERKATGDAEILEGDVVDDD